jgi:hypothetical protein
MSNFFKNIFSYVKALFSSTSNTLETKVKASAEELTTKATEKAIAEAEEKIDEISQGLEDKLD